MKNGEEQDSALGGRWRETVGCGLPHHSPLKQKQQTMRSDLFAISRNTLTRLLRAGLTLGLLAVTAGCNYFAGGYRLVSVAPVVPPRGFLYSHFKAPLVLPAPSDLGEAPPSKGQVVYIKIPTPYLNTEFSLGRADIEAACRRAGIKTLIGADYEYRSVAGYVKTFTIHAYGYPVEGKAAADGGG